MHTHGRFELPQDVSTKVLDYLHASEVCANSRVSTHFRDDVARWLGVPRAVCHRPGTDAEPSQWLHDLVCRGVKIESITLDSSPQGMKQAFSGFTFPKYDWAEPRKRKNFVCDAYVAALYCASTNGFAEVVALLLSLTSADPSKRITKWWQETALHGAIASDRTEVVALLLADERTTVTANPRWNNSSWEKTAPVAVAAALGHVESFRLVVKHKSFDGSSRGRWQYAVFMKAFEHGHVPVLKEMCSNHDVDVNFRILSYDCDDCGVYRVPLIIAAAKRGYTDFVDYLCCDPRTDVDARDHERNSLAFAIEGGHVGIVNRLLALKFEQGRELHLTDERSRAIVAELENAGRTELTLYELTGRTPLHEAARLGRLDEVKALCGEQKQDTDMNAARGSKDAARSTADADINAARDSEDAARSTADADINSTRGSEGAVRGSADADIDAARCSVDAARSTADANINAARDSEDADINAVDNDAMTPLLHAAEGAHVDVVKFLCERFQNDIDVNVTDKTSWSPLHYAVFRGELDMVRCLCGMRSRLCEGADGECDASILPSATTTVLFAGEDLDAEFPPLGVDALRGSVDAARGAGGVHATKLWLRRYGRCEPCCKVININARTIYGDTVFHLVARWECSQAVAIAEVLCAHPCADSNILNDQNHAPVDLAKVYDVHPRILALLEERFVPSRGEQPSVNRRQMMKPDGEYEANIWEEDCEWGVWGKKMGIAKGRKAKGSQRKNKKVKSKHSHTALLNA